MEGAYCLIVQVPEDIRVVVGRLGRKVFRSGTYAYVGSALAGIEGRIRRHKSHHKRKRWHIDYLLANAEIMATVAIPGNRKDIECSVAKALLRCEGASVPVPGFGSSDCSCDSHLVFFGDVDPQWVSETILMHLAMLECIYPKRTALRRRTQPRRE